MPPERLNWREPAAIMKASWNSAVPSLLEQVFVVATALIFWTDSLALAFPGELDAPSFVFRTTVLGIYGIVLVLLARRPVVFRRALVVSPALMALLFMPALSAIWSIEPDVTLHRSFALLGSSMFGVYLATHLPLTRTLFLLGIAGTLAALISLILIGAVPRIGIMQGGEYLGVWRGAYHHKNAFGQMTALGAIVCWLALQNTHGSGAFVFGAGLAMNLLLLAGSKSFTAQFLFIVCAVILFSAGAFVRGLVNNFLVLLPFLAIASIGATIAISGYDVAGLLFSLGKDATLSARVPMWQEILPFANDRFWLGYGYEVFWRAGHYPIDIITQRIRFNPVYAHNGLLELWLGLGITGVAIFCAAFAQFIVYAGAMLYRAPKHPIYLLSVVFIVMTVLQNVSEVTLLQRNSMSWILFVMLSVVLATRFHGFNVGATTDDEPGTRLPQVASTQPKLLVV